MKPINLKNHVVKVGIYQLGAENVVLYLGNENGGCFSLAPSDGSQPFISVGHYSGEKPWSRVVEVLTHELMEFVMARRGWRWMPAPEINDSQADYLFVVTHEQMAVVAESVGYFMSCALPDLAGHFNAVVKASKKKTK